MTSVLPVQCFACAHLDRSAADPGGAAVPSRCVAYPTGIPDEIAMYGADHRVARGDETNGVVFAQAPSDDARDAFGWWQHTFGNAQPVKAKQEGAAHAADVA
jgi:hypothetical protein